MFVNLFMGPSIFGSGQIDIDVDYMRLHTEIHLGFVVLFELSCFLCEHPRVIYILFFIIESGPSFCNLSRLVIIFI